MQQQLSQTSLPGHPQRPRAAPGAALLLAALMALLNYLIWGWANAPAAGLIATPGVLPRVHGIAYAPFARARMRRGCATRRRLM